MTEVPRGSSAIVARAAPLALAALALAAYANTFHAPFIFDDAGDILGNAAIRAVWPPGWLFAPRPFAALSFALTHAAFGFRVEGWHAVNLAIHVGAAVAMFDLVRTTLTLPALAPRFAARAPRVALAAAAIWVVHPLLTSAVTYVVHRYESLCGLLYLTAMAAFARACRAPRSRVLVVVAALSCWLAAATKEIAVTIPAVILLYDRCFVARSWREVLTARARAHAAIAIVWVLFAVALPFRRANASQGFAFADLGPFDYARSELGVLARYLRLAVWPRDLSIDYFDWPIARSLADVAPGAALVAAIVAAGLVSLRVAPPLAFALLAWLVVLAPTSSFVPLRGELVAERRMYVPLVFLIAAVTAGVDLALARARAVKVPVVVVVVAALGLATRRENAFFASGVSVFEHVLASRPGNVRARYHLGLELASAGREDEALAAFERAAGAEPRCWACSNNAGTLRARRGEVARAIPWFEAAVAARPDEVSFRRNLEAALEKAGRWTDAVAAQREIARREPSPASLERLARLLSTAPDAGARDGGAAIDAATSALAALRGAPPTLQLLYTVATSHAEAARWDDAARAASAFAAAAMSSGRADAASRAERLRAAISRREPVRMDGVDARP